MLKYSGCPKTGRPKSRKREIWMGFYPSQVSNNQLYFCHATSNFRLDRFLRLPTPLGCKLRWLRVWNRIVYNSDSKLSKFGQLFNVDSDFLSYNHIVDYNFKLFLIYFWLNRLDFDWFRMKSWSKIVSKMPIKRSKMLIKRLKMVKINPKSQQINVFFELFWYIFDLF